MSQEVQQQLEAAGIIPVLRARSAKEAIGVVEAMVAGGITVIEVTMTVPGAIDVLRELKRSYGDKLLLGSGTVTDGEECDATIDAGAEFVVSPSLHLDVIQATLAPTSTKQMIRELLRWRRAKAWSRAHRQSA